MMKKTAILLMAFFLTLSLCAQVRLANIFSDNMVLQAHRPIKIWGYAPVGENVKVVVDEQVKTVVSDEMGKWQLLFPPMDYGKDVKVKVVGRQNEIELENVLIGDVWLCSGQSNMAMTVNGEGGQVYNYKVEESKANYPGIRSFKVIPSVSVKSGVDVDGRWEVCSPETVSNFSAVAYFFAREIHQKRGIPIGIINSSWGGTDIETWMSMDSFQLLPDLFTSKYNNAKVEDIGIILENNEEKRKAFESVVENDIGEKEKWYAPEFNSESWEFMSQPQEWGSTALASFDGVVWFRYQFMVLEEDANQAGVLSLGKVDDNDVTWINGIRIGETKGAGVDRYYQIPQGVLKKGANVIVIKVADVIRAGGLTGKEEDLYIETTGG
ncbi:sialate O-acetylesterase, partial [Proteiniphilum sp.]|uniref:sialate O-acetylesterase n=1 Tax=Proteiniphilum sp. TaxID=1926877 RepID=UPI00331F133A